MMMMDNSLSNDKLVIEDLKKNVDMVFLIITGCFIFFIKVGFAFFECSFVRAKNVTSVLFRNYFDSVISTLAYLFFGYGLAFGEAENGFCGTQYFGLVGLPDDKLAHCFFHYTFASCAGTIISGVVHERCTMTAYFCYTFLISGFVYPVTVYWVATDNGWLKVLGFDDFAYGAVVHAMGGSAALAAAYMAGPRLGRFDEFGAPRHTTIHSLPEAVAGLFIFFLGMIAFNFGSLESIGNLGDGRVIITVVMNMMVCVIASTFTALFYHRFIVNRTPRGWDTENGLNGGLIGMVVVCAGCDSYPFWGAALLGITGYLVFLPTRHLIRNMLQIDDVLDGVSLHIAGGYWGTIGVSIFKEGGILLNPSKATAYALMINTVGGLAIMLWSFSIIFGLYCILRWFHLHRTSSMNEKTGLDLSIHMQPAYDDLLKGEKKSAFNNGKGEGAAAEKPNSSISHIEVPNVGSVFKDINSDDYVPLEIIRRTSYDDSHIIIVHRVSSPK